MPIDRETFDEASAADLVETADAEAVVRFLLENDERAFTLPEIAAEIDAGEQSVETVLHRLENDDLVQHKGDYWAVGDEERVRDAFRFHRTVEDLNERFGPENVEGWREHAPDDSQP